MAAKEDVRVSGDVCTCSLVCMHVWGCTYAHVHGEQRPAISIFLTFSPPCFSKQGLSLNLALTSSDSGQTVSPLSLPPQLWDYRCTLFNLAFMCVLGEAGSVPWCRWVSEDNMEGKLVLSVHNVGPENQPGWPLPAEPSLRPAPCFLSLDPDWMASTCCHSPQLQENPYTDYLGLALGCLTTAPMKIGEVRNVQNVKMNWILLIQTYPEENLSLMKI